MMNTTLPDGTQLIPPDAPSEAGEADTSSGDSFFGQLDELDRGQNRSNVRTTLLAVSRVQVQKLLARVIEMADKDTKLASRLEPVLARANLEDELTSNTATLVEIQLAFSDMKPVSVVQVSQAAWETAKMILTGFVAPSRGTSTHVRQSA